MVRAVAWAFGVNGCRRWCSLFNPNRQFDGVHRVAWIVANARDGKARLQKTDVAWSDPGIVRSGNYDPAFGFGSCARRHRRTLNPPYPNRHHYSGSVDGAAVHHLYTWTLPATTRASALIRRAKGFSF